jgi:hypothetical protein
MPSVLMFALLIILQSYYQYPDMWRGWWQYLKMKIGR